MVVPLVPVAEFPKPARVLHPIFEIDGHKYVMVSHFLAAVMVTDLGRPVGSLADHHFTIVASLDLLLSGF